MSLQGFTFIVTWRIRRICVILQPQLENVVNHSMVTYEHGVISCSWNICHRSWYDSHRFVQTPHTQDEMQLYKKKKRWNVHGALVNIWRDYGGIVAAKRDLSSCRTHARTGPSTICRAEVYDTECLIRHTLQRIYKYVTCMSFFAATIPLISRSIYTYEHNAHYYYLPLLGV